MDTAGVNQEIDRIIEAREAKGMTIRELSVASGVPQATVQRILSGTAKNPSHQAISALSEALSLGKEIEAPELPEASEDKVDQLIALYRYQLERQRHDYENRIAAQTRDNNLREYRFRRRCFIQEVIIWLLVLVIISVLILDAVNGNIGFIRYMSNFWADAKHTIKNML